MNEFCGYEYFIIGSNEDVRHSKVMSDFNEWWNSVGSAIRPLDNEDTEEFAERIARLAYLTAEGFKVRMSEEP